MNEALCGATRVVAALIWAANLAACGHPAASNPDPSMPGSRATRSVTVPPNDQWTPDDIAVFERIATGQAGTAIDLAHLTQEQLANVGRRIRQLHSVAYPGGRAERRAVALWMVGTSQVRTVLCASTGDMVPSSAGTPYLVEFTLAAVASAIEGGDTTQQQLAALEGVLTNYQASRAEGAPPEPLLDALLADKAAGRLEERAAVLARCIDE